MVAKNQRDLHSMCLHVFPFSLDGSRRVPGAASCSAVYLRANAELTDVCADVSERWQSLLHGPRNAEGLELIPQRESIDPLSLPSEISHGGINEPLPLRVPCGSSSMHPVHGPSTWGGAAVMNPGGV